MDRINQFASSAKQATSSAINHLSRIVAKSGRDNRGKAFLEQNRGKSVEEVIRDMEKNSLLIYAREESGDMNSQGSNNSQSRFVEVIKSDVEKEMKVLQKTAVIKKQEALSIAYKTLTGTEAICKTDNHDTFGIELLDLKPKYKKS